MATMLLRSLCRQVANVFSSCLFSWFHPLITKSQSQKLLPEHMFPLPNDMQARNIIASFQISWNHVANNKKYKMFYALHHMIFCKFWIAGLFRLASDILVVICAVMIKYIVQAANSSTASFISLLSLTYFTLSLCQAICLQQFIHGCFVTGAQATAAATAAIFHATLNLRLRAMPFTAGEVNNIQGKDAASLREFVVFAHNLWACPLTILLCVIALMYIVGWVAVLCFALLVILLPLESRIAALAKKYRKEALHHADKRCSLLHEMIDGIKTLKFSGFMDVTQEKVERMRLDELQSYWKSIQLEIVNSVLSHAAPAIATLVTIVVYLWTHDDPLTAANAFTVLAIINILGRPIKVLPKTISLYAAAIVSLERIESFIESCYSGHVSFDDYDNAMNVAPPLVFCRHLSATLNDRLILSDINLSLSEPGLVLLLGSNKSGKSTLLLSLLQEIQHSGDTMIHADFGCVAYCGHEPWIRNDTALNNITCTSRDTMLASNAIQACQLQLDFDSFPQREHTILGERGVMVSGGQKSRISLARAMCSQCNVVILDNPLSALDANVSKQVFLQSILKMAESAIVLMTTHDSNLLGYAKHIIVLSNEGRIEFSGPYSMLMTGAHASLLDHWKSDTYTKPSIHGSDDTVTIKKNENTNTSGGDGDIGLEQDFAVLLYDYMKSCGFVLCIVTVVLSCCCYGFGAYTDIILARYTDSVALSTSVFQLSYSFCSLAVIAITVSRYYVGMLSGLRGSKRLHHRLLQSILNGTISFFSSTASGRILSRFTGDMDQIDNSIPSGIISTIDAMLSVLVPIIVSLYGVPMYIFFIAPLAYYYVSIRNMYRSPSQDLKRIDGGNKSPLYSHFKEVLNGLESIRAYRLQNKMLEEHYQLLDNCSQSRYNWDICNRWLGVRLDIIGTLIVSFAILSIAIYGQTTPGTTGLVISYAVKATNNLSFAIRASTSLENVLLSLERVLQYIYTVPQEQSSVIDTSMDTNASALMVMKDVYVRYDQSLPFVLRGVNICLREGSLVGICGRTGCGKSTLSLVLSRGIQINDGHIYYQNQNVSAFSLKQYRSSIVQVFPQDSYIFSGTLRDILDPSYHHSDMYLLELLNRFSPSTDHDWKLQMEIKPNGSNLSSGERQIVILVQSLLSPAKVVVVDEVTSNMDTATALIAMQQLREYLVRHGKCVIVVCHRASDMKQCDEVYEMIDGTLTLH